ASGLPVDLGAPKRPPPACGVTTTGCGPESVAAKRPVPPAKSVPAVHPLGKAAATAAVAGRPGPGTAGGEMQAAAFAGDGAAPTDGGPGPPPPGQPPPPPGPPTTARPRGDPGLPPGTGKVKSFDQ